MKSLLLVYENAAAGPRAELDRRTPLQVARCPAATRLAAEGMCGLLAKPPFGEAPRAEALLAALLGVPRPEAWRLARGPLEAEAVGADWLTFNYAFRADLVTLDQGVMHDAHLARLTRTETDRLVAVVQAELDAMNVRLMPVKEGRAVLLAQSDDPRPEPGYAPWLLEGQDEAPRPEGKRAKLMREVMERAASVLARQTINDVRVDLGENPATDVWLWSGGPRPEILEKFGGRDLRGLMVTQSAMARGLALRLGMAVEALPEPWLVTEGEAAPAVTGEQAAGWFQNYDVVAVYVEAPPLLVEGPPAERVRLLDRLDLLLTAPLLEAIKKVKQRRMVLATVPAASLRPAPRSAEHPPVVVWGAHVHPDEVKRWDEDACSEGELEHVEAMDLFGRLVGG